MTRIREEEEVTLPNCLSVDSTWELSNSSRDQMK